MTPMLSKEQVSALLGRSLSTIENNNFDLYLDIAIERLEDLLCITLTNPLESGLQLLLARCFGVISEEQAMASELNVREKKVEDFSISYNEKEVKPMEMFVSLNDGLLEKYSECQARPRQGKVCHGHGIHTLWLR